MNSLFNKKKKMIFLKKYFQEYSLDFYLKNILSYDLIFKILNLNIFQINNMLNSQQIEIKINITKNLNAIKEINDSLSVLNMLTKQKSNLKIYKNNYYIINLLRKDYYNFFLYFFCFYIYPIFQKRNFDKKKLLNFYILKEFNLFLNPQYDFLMNLLIFIQFKFNIKNSNINFLYLSSLKLI